MSNAPVVILCGFMATGKTTVGRALAQQLGVPFVDTDELVEARAGATEGTDFASQGRGATEDEDESGGEDDRSA